jgi:hypothetical protein
LGRDIQGQEKNLKDGENIEVTLGKHIDSGLMEIVGEDRLKDLGRCITVDLNVYWIEEGIAENPRLFIHLVGGAIILRMKESKPFIAVGAYCGGKPSQLTPI